MNVKEYTKESYRIGIHFGLNELEDLKIESYVNGFKIIIEYELNTQYFSYIVE